MSQFQHLKSYDPKGRKAWYTLPLKGGPKLEMCHAGRTNRPYTDAVAKRNAKSRVASRVARGQIDSTILEEAIATDRELFPKYIITRWEGVFDDEGNEVAFSHGACKEYLDALPDWIVQDLSGFATTPYNFIDEDMPSEEDVDDQAEK